jgi:hypothetical protein
VETGRRRRSKAIFLVSSAKALSHQFGGGMIYIRRHPDA